MALSLRKAISAALLAIAIVVAAARPATAQALADQALQDRIAFALNTYKVPRVYDLKVSVVDGVTTLTGMVATAEQRTDVEKLARMAGAGSIVNAVLINRDVEQMLADRRAPGFSRSGDPIADDTAITNRVRFLFMRDEQIRGGDVTIDTVNGVVTLRGRVRTEPGRFQALELAEAVPGVRRVVDLLVIGR